MKMIQMISLIAASTFAMNALGATKHGINYHIINEHAQLIYDTMTEVPGDGAAGHILNKEKVYFAGVSTLISMMQMDISYRTKIPDAMPAVFLSIKTV